MTDGAYLIVYVLIGLSFAELFRWYAENKGDVADGTVAVGYVLAVAAWPLIIVASTIAACFFANKEK